MSRIILALMLLALIVGQFSALLLAQDHRGSIEMPLFARYPDSVIKDQGVKAFDRVEFVTESLPGPKFSGLTVEGRRVWTVLQGPRGRSALEVFINYQHAAETAGFKTLYTCSRQQCAGRLFYDGLGGASNEVVGAMSRAGDGSIDDSHYLVAQRVTPSGTETMRLVTRGPVLPVALVDIVQSAPMEQRVTLLDANKIASELNQNGKAALYAIFFDTDSAELKPESKPQLAELAGFLRANAEVRVYVVGHTDARGSMEHNSDLARRRAEAVSAALARDHGIAAARILPFGVGELAPLASNDTEAGRAKNRRVEIVKRLD